MRASTMAASKIFFGATVTGADASGLERTVTIMGIDESDSLAGEVSRIAIARPCSKARVGMSSLVVAGGRRDHRGGGGQLPGSRLGLRTARPAFEAPDTLHAGARQRRAAPRPDGGGPAPASSRSISGGFAQRRGLVVHGRWVMSASAAATAWATWANTPLPLVNNTPTPTSKLRVSLGPTHLDPVLAAVEEPAADRHSAVWMIRPSPRPRWPRTSSPGIGRRQGANCTEAPSAALKA